MVVLSDRPLSVSRDGFFLFMSGWYMILPFLGLYELFIVIVDFVQRLLKNNIGVDLFNFILRKEILMFFRIHIFLTTSPWSFNLTSV